jgi:hypothetical protein
MTEDQRTAWNAALEMGDSAEIARLQREILRGIHERIMNDDPNYSAAGWKA